MSFVRLRAMGQRAISVVADVSDAKQVREMVNQTVTHFGKIDILVNNAGTIAGKDRVQCRRPRRRRLGQGATGQRERGVPLFSGSSTPSHRPGNGWQNYQYVIRNRKTGIGALRRI